MHDWWFLLNKQRFEVCVETALVTCRLARLGSSGCSTKFLDADVTGLLASASVIVDDGKKVFGSTESYIEHMVTGQELLKLRKSGVCVLQLDTQ